MSALPVRTARSLVVRHGDVDVQRVVAAEEAGRGAGRRSR